MSLRRKSNRRCRIKWILAYLAIQLFCFSSYFFSRNMMFLSDTTYKIISKETISLNGRKRCDILFLPTSCRVIDCYKYNQRERFQICSYIYKELYLIGFHERSIQSLEAELALHVYCYNLGIEIDHSKDADLDVYGDSRWYVMASYSFLEILGI